MKVAVIGGGPAGLMAAEAAFQRGAQVEVYDAMPSVGRKFLLAGKGGSISLIQNPRRNFLLDMVLADCISNPFLRNLGPMPYASGRVALGSRPLWVLPAGCFLPI